MQPEYTPPESQIIDCMKEIQEKGESSYGASVQMSARLRLADFSACLAEWRIATALPNSSPLPAVAHTLEQKTPLDAESAQKMLAFLQQRAHAGNRTAVLYLAYLFAKGLYVPQSPATAVSYSKKLAEQGDWRATRFAAEILLAAPQLTEKWLDQVIPAARQWQLKHTQLSAEEVNANIQRFYLAPLVNKFTIRQLLEQAAEQGSPTAAKRLRGLTVLGEIPVSLPARPFQNIEHWLDKQVVQLNHPIDDEDIYVLPENVSFLPQADEDDAKPVWVKPAVYACFATIGLLILVMLLKWR